MPRHTPSRTHGWSPTTIAVGLGLALAALVVAAGAAQATHSTWSLDAGSHKEDHADFGQAVDVDGDTAIVGAYTEDGPGSHRGAAYVFTYAGGSWTLEQRLTPRTPKDGAWFGTSVALDGDTALVGARNVDNGGTDQGAAYVFTRSGGSWSQEDKLKAGAPQDDAEFGDKVVLQGDTAIVGAPKEDHSGGKDRGAAYVFTRSGGSWSLEDALRPSGLPVDARLGGGVALDQDTALVGAPAEDLGGSARGATYVFTRSSGSWSSQAKLTPTQHSDTARFGDSMALQGDTAVIGAEGMDAGLLNQGAAYVFERSSGAWSQQQRLLGPSPERGGFLGGSVDVDGSTLLVGGTGMDGATTDSGITYAFTENGGTWSHDRTLTDPTPEKDSLFGYSVGLDQGHAVVGAKWTDLGGSRRGETIVLQLDEAPTAGFSASPSSPTDHDAVGFTDRTTDDVGGLSWSWDFDDGSTSSAQSPSHRFATGSYNVCLTVTDRAGHQDKACRTASVTNAPPQAGFSAKPSSPSPGETVAFADTSSDGAGSLTRWSWHFGDGGSSSKQNPVHTYTSPGDYRVCLTATDGDGATDRRCRTLTVRNEAPTAAFELQPSDPKAGDTVHFTGKSQDADGRIRSRSWDFGDGATASTGAPTHAFDDPGTYDVCLTVTDDRGARDADCQTIQVASNPPTADFTLEPTDVRGGQPVDFTDTSTDRDGPLDAWSWSFGDGRSSTERSPTHRFPDDGTYTVCLTVEDEQGVSHERCRAVVVDNAAPTVQAPAPQAGDVEAGRSVPFSVSPRDPDGSVASIEWRFGDGTTANGTDPSHAYEEPGTYEVTVEVTDDDGTTTTRSRTVEVDGGVPWAGLLLGGAGLGVAAGGTVAYRRREQVSRRLQDWAPEGVELPESPFQGSDEASGDEPGEEARAGWARRFAGERG